MLVVHKDWQEQYYLFIHQTIHDEHHARLKAQMIFALVHGSMISSWIKQDKADLELIQEGIVDILKR